MDNPQLWSKLPYDNSRLVFAKQQANSCVDTTMQVIYFFHCQMSTKSSINSPYQDFGQIWIYFLIFGVTFLHHQCKFSFGSIFPNDWYQRLLNILWIKIIYDEYQHTQIQLDLSKSQLISNTRKHQSTFTKTT